MIGAVFKFGGTSLGSLERIERVADLCVRLRPACVVVSAMSGETNRLLSLGRSLCAQIDTPEHDLLLASGKQVSVALLSLALRKRGIKPAPMIASRAGIITTAEFSRASIVRVDTTTIIQSVESGCTPVVAGFQGVTSDGLLTTIGRGGSDTSAVALAAAMQASECVIYTDVDGVFTADPRLCPEAKLIPLVDYDEMLELASQGAKVLHIRSVQLAAKWSVQLRVRNTFSDAEGTLMVHRQTFEGEVVTGIASSQQEALISMGPLAYLPDIQARVFSALAHDKINVDVIAQHRPVGGSEISFQFTVALADVERARIALRHVFPNASLWVDDSVAKVSIVGVGMRVQSGVAGRMFSVLAGAGIEIRLVTTSEIKVACLIDRSQEQRAVEVLHREFFAKEDEIFHARGKKAYSHEAVLTRDTPPIVDIGHI